MKTYRVIDEIFSETIDFTSELKAEQEAERRLALHRSGFNLRRNHISGCNAILLKRDKTYIITTKTEV